MRHNDSDYVDADSQANNFLGVFFYEAIFNCFTPILRSRVDSETIEIEIEIDLRF